MNAPTDTFLQEIMQMVNPEFQAYIFILMLIMASAALMVVAVLLVGALSLASRRLLRRHLWSYRTPNDRHFLLCDRHEVGQAVVREGNGERCKK